MNLVFALLLILCWTYASKGVRVFRELMQTVKASYGERQAKASRRRVALRAFLWIIPPKMYHWKEVRWLRQANALSEDLEERDSQE